MDLIISFSRSLTMKATSLLSVIALIGCVPIEGETPKICVDPKANPYGTTGAQRCKMVQTKPGVTPTPSGRRANY